MGIVRRTTGIVMSIAVCILMASAISISAGSLNSPGAPDNSDSSFYTLEDIYKRLDAGTTGTPSVFTEPTAWTEAGVMHTLSEIMGKAPVVDTNGAAITDVLLGKTFWGLKSGAWGPRTGTMVNVGAQAITPGTSEVTITQGYHNGSGSVAGDVDLLAANIKKNVTIFNVAGTYSGSAGSVSVPKTGQTTTVPLNPAPPGSDGALQYGVAWPTPRFTNNNNGTVTDNLTGLIWLQKISCLEEAYWEQSLTLCYNLASSHVACNLNDGSKAGDWRMPNISELESVRAVNYTYPALSNDAGTGKWVIGSADSSFTYVKTTYWSSTSVASDTTLAWNMNMGTGVMGSTSKPFVAGTANWLYVWPVRGGQK